MDYITSLILDFKNYTFFKFKKAVHLICRLSNLNSEKFLCCTKMKLMILLLIKLLLDVHYNESKRWYKIICLSFFIKISFLEKVMFLKPYFSLHGKPYKFQVEFDC